MDADKLSTGEKVAAVSGILLFIFMFFDWFGVSISGGGETINLGGGGNAWDTLDFIPIVLLIAVVAAVGVAVLRLIDSTWEPPVSMNAVVAALGGLSVLLILFRIIDPPSFASIGGVSAEGSVKFGIFLVLIAAAGIAYGGYLAMKEEGTSFGETADRLSGGTGAEPSGGPPPPPPPPPPPSSPPPPPPPPPSSGV